MERIDPVLGYTFAKERGVVLLERGDSIRLGSLGSPSAATLVEARGGLGAPR